MNSPAIRAALLKGVPVSRPNVPLEKELFLGGVGIGSKALAGLHGNENTSM